MISEGIYNKKLGVALFTSEKENGALYDSVSINSGLILSILNQAATGTYIDKVTNKTRLLFADVESIEIHTADAPAQRIKFNEHPSKNRDHQSVRWLLTDSGLKDEILIFGSYKSTDGARSYPVFLKFFMPLYSDFWNEWITKFATSNYSDNLFKKRSQENRKYFHATMAAIEDFFTNHGLNIKFGDDRFGPDSVQKQPSYLIPNDELIKIDVFNNPPNPYDYGIVPPPTNSKNDYFTISGYYTCGYIPKAETTSIEKVSGQTGEIEKYYINQNTGIKTQDDSQGTKQHKQTGIKGGFIFSDPSIIIEVQVKKDIPSLFKDYLDRQNAKNQPKPPADEKPLTASDVSKEEATKYHSGLEYFIRSIQLYTLSKFIDNGIKDKGKFLEVLELDLTQDKFIQESFSNGVLKDIIQTLIDNPESLKNIDKDQSAITLMQAYASYGFNHNLMGTSNNNLSESVNQVDFKELFKSWAVPYKLSTGVVSQTNVNYPIYIKLGLLLMIINHMCTIYDSESGESVTSDKQTPLIYIDFNPETNICLTQPLQTSLDVLKFLVPFAGTNEEYTSLFDNILIDKTNGTQFIQGPEEPGSDGKNSTNTATNLFLPKSEDLLSGQLPKFRVTNGAGQEDAFRGKIMNILINTEYLLSLCQDFSSKNESQAVYLKPFLQQLITDMNKSMGDVNLFRLAYSDTGNCMYIVDDQMAPGHEKEENLRSTLNTEYSSPTIPSTTLPLFGANSIAKSLSINTEVSSRLANMIAISANSDQKSASGKDGSPFGHISENFIDRFRPQVLSIDGGNKPTGSINGADIAAASAFNIYMTTIFGTNSPSTENLPSALNYYIERMNKIKSERSGTKSSAMIPVSIEFKTDGISGLAMGHAFTVPDALLPNTYSNTFARGKDKKEKNRIGFVVIGLNHSLQNNLWETDIKANMIYLKDKDDYTTDGFYTGSLSNREFSDISTAPGLPPNSTITGGSGKSGQPCGYDAANRKVYPADKYPDTKYVQTKIDKQSVISYINSTSYSKEVKRATYASFGIESGYGNSGINNNLNGMQTDGGGWKLQSKYIIGTTSIFDSGGGCRAFAVYRSWQECCDHVLAIMDSRKEGSKHLEIVPSPNNSDPANFFAVGYGKNWIGSYNAQMPGIYQSATKIFT